MTRLRGFATLGLLLALLGCGARPDATPAIRSIRPDANTCRFSFTARGLPEAAFYLVGIGKRRPLPFSRGELSQDGWTLNIALGSGG